MQNHIRVPINVIDTIYALPKRYHAAMLHLLLNLRRLPQERYDVVAETISMRAYEHRFGENDIEEFADLLVDPRVDDNLLDWFISYPIATPDDLRALLERPRSVT